MCNNFYFLQQLWPLYSSVCALQERTVQFVRFLSHKPKNDGIIGSTMIIDNENQLLSLNKHIIFRQKMFFFIQVWALYTYILYSVFAISDKSLWPQFLNFVQIL
jgi:hypothetical protein